MCRTRENCSLPKKRRLARFERKAPGFDCKAGALDLSSPEKCNIWFLWQGSLGVCVCFFLDSIAIIVSTDAARGYGKSVPLSTKNVGVLFSTYVVVVTPTHARAVCAQVAICLRSWFLVLGSLVIVHQRESLQGSSVWIPFALF